MKKTYMSLLLASLLGLSFGSVGVLASESQAITFEKSIGGKDDDIGKSVIVLDDGYLIVGKSKSFSKNRDFNVYAVRVNKHGEKVWSKHFGSKEDDEANQVIETTDGYVLVGSSEKIGNDRKSIYMIKLEKNGKRIWERAYYSNKYDYYEGNGVVKSDQGYIVASSEKHPKLFNEQVQVYIVATDENGQAIGRKRFGGDEEDYANAIIATEGGFMVAGATESFGHGDLDAYVIKMDPHGKRIWSRAFGGSDDDVANDIKKTSDGGYIAVGTTDSFGRRYNDVYVVKMNANGNRVWHRAFGGSKDEEGHAVVEVEDGYVIAGSAESYGEGLRSDMYLFKVDKKGRLVWERIFGGEQDDVAYDLAKTDDGFILVGEISDNRTRYKDVYMVKTDKNGKLK